MAFAAPQVSDTDYEWVMSSQAEALADGGALFEGLFRASHGIGNNRGLPYRKTKRFAHQVSHGSGLKKVAVHQASGEPVKKSKPLPLEETSAIPAKYLGHPKKLAPKTSKEVSVDE